MTSITLEWKVVAVPKKTCEACNGNGVCRVCKGSGKKGTWVTTRCGTCNGTGTCSPCDGAGKR